jgi:hypothetical protein
VTVLETAGAGMSDIGEGLGGAVEGAMAGRAVEPSHGEHGRQTEALPEGTCLNCGAAPAGNYCQNCGQSTNIHRSIAAIGHDLLHGVLHLDGKLWRTLPLLAFRPGKLTRRYIDGERAKFVSPMAMFLFSVFLMFALFQALGISTPTDVPGSASEQVDQLVEAESDRLDAQVLDLEAQLANDDLSQAEREAVELQLQERLSEIDLLDTRATGISEWLLASGSSGVEDIQAAAEAEIANARERLAALPAGSPEHDDLSAEISIAQRGLESLQTIDLQAGPDGVEGPKASESDVSGTDLADGKTGISMIDNIVAKWRENPSLMLYKMQNNAYKFSWLLIPLSIPFVGLMFLWKRRFRAYDHAIFVTYSLGFMSLLYIAISLLGRIGFNETLLLFGSLIIPPVHIYKQLRGTYQLGRFSALWRLIMLMFFIAIVIALFAQALLLLGGY